MEEVKGEMAVEEMVSIPNEKSPINQNNDSFISLMIVSLV